MVVSRCAFALLFAVSWPGPTQAHDIYKALRDGAGKSCCNNFDCRPAPYRTTQAGVQMLVDGRWLAVPENTIQHRA